MTERFRHYWQIISKLLVCPLVGHDWFGPDFHLCDRCGFVEGEAKDLLEFAIEQVVGGCKTTQHDEQNRC